MAMSTRPSPDVRVGRSIGLKQPLCYLAGESQLELSQVFFSLWWANVRGLAGSPAAVSFHCLRGVDTHRRPLALSDRSAILILISAPPGWLSLARSPQQAWVNKSSLLVRRPPLRKRLGSFLLARAGHDGRRKPTREGVS